jgi:transglutaminase-like putative cysteine protease
MTIPRSFSIASLTSSILATLLAIGLFGPIPARAGIGFQAVPAEELKMTSEPQSPGAPAILLYRQLDRDDNGRTSHEDNYYRIKILTEEGRKYADVEIPYFKGNNVVGVHARTIKPDGTIVEFDGKVYDKTIAKARGLKYSAKTFTLPDVQVGSIIEYYYTYDLKEYALYESNWILSDELFTKSAKFSLKPYRSTFENPFHLRWNWQGLPPGTAQPTEGPDHIIRLEAHNIPAFQTEDFMPPANELKSRVDFIYSQDDPESDPDRFWQKIDKKRNGFLETFIGKQKAMEGAAAQIVSPNDPPETKLRKIYDRVQALRNTSYELRKTEQEEKREKEKPPANVEELWKHGYGDAVELTWLYLALVRAAGFEAYGCWVSNRRQYFFNRITMQSGKLNANVVQVKLNGKDMYFDPGAAFTPFGLLTWSETGTPGLCLDKDGGKWIQTSLPLSSESQILREAKLKLSDTGDLEGTLKVTYTGLEAMYRRLELRNSDDVERKKFLEDQLKEQVPGAAELELTNKPDWSGTETPLVAELNLKISGWASSAGQRVILPVGFFSAHEKRVFEHANRVHPIYFEYPYEMVDDVSVELPAGWQVSSAPPAQTQNGHIIVYDLKVENGNGKVHVVRKLNVDILILDPKYYPALRNFFQVVRTGDEEQILLQPAATSARN